MPVKVRRIDFSADEWLGGTIELKPYDRGVYITLCALIYSRGERIGIELLARHCGVHRNQLNAAVRRLEAAGKIEVLGTSLRQVRCELEIKNAVLRAKKWAENLPQSRKTNELGDPLPPARARRTINHHKRKEEDKGSDPVRAGARLEGVDELVADTLASLQGKTAAPYPGKRDQWLNNLAGFVGQALDDDARMEAWQAIEDARAAGSRDATPQHIRNAIDRIDKLYRTAHAMEAAA
jgi:hypothetical protein